MPAKVLSFLDHRAILPILTIWLFPFILKMNAGWIFQKTVLWPVRCRQGHLLPMLSLPYWGRNPSELLRYLPKRRIEGEMLHERAVPALATSCVGIQLPATIS